MLPEQLPREAGAYAYEGFAKTLSGLHEKNAGEFRSSAAASALVSSIFFAVSLGDNESNEVKGVFLVVGVIFSYMTLRGIVNCRHEFKAQQVAANIKDKETEEAYVEKYGDTCNFGLACCFFYVR